MLLNKLILECLSQFHDVVHVTFLKCGQHSSSILRIL